MAYSIVAIREAGDEDGRLFPTVSDDGSSIGFEEWDGSIRHLTASGLIVSEAVAGGLRTLAGVGDSEVDVFITDSRVAIACSKYEKSGGWHGFTVGGMAVAAAANAGSRALAGRRSRGKLLVGQVRYQWLKLAGFTSRTGRSHPERIRLGTSTKGPDGTTRDLMLDLSLPKGASGQELASDIVRRAAIYRLAHTQPRSPDERTRFEQLQRTASLPTESLKKFACCRLPSFYYVSPPTM